jgi:type I restriction enzyme R subunit
MDNDGKIITESLRDYSKRNIQSEYKSLDAFLRTWSQADKKQAVVDQLEKHGVLLSALNEELGSVYDPFDLVCHIAFEQKPLTRKERAQGVRKNNYFSKYGELARKVIDALLEKYSDDGLIDLENPAVITLDPIKKLGTPPEIIRAFGGKDEYSDAIHLLTEVLYKTA